MEVATRERRVSRGWPVFIIMWLGQIVSLLGSEMTSFALDLWVYQETKSTTLFALMIFFTLTPSIVLGPFAGALVDRWDRKRVLIAADVGAAIITLGVFALFNFGTARVWHLYVAVAGSSILGAFQTPAYQASVTLLVPEKDYGRASGLSDVGIGVIKVGAPVLAGFLLGVIGLNGIILVDVVTFMVAVLALILIKIPVPRQSEEGKAGAGSLFKEASLGWRFISQHPGFVGLLAFLALNNFLQGLVLSIFIPMVLSFSTEEVVGQVVTIALSGLIVGGAIMMVWGGPRRRIFGILFGSMIVGIVMVLGGLKANVVLITAAGFIYWLLDPIIYGSSRAIWQSRIPADIQGRVFSAIRVTTWSTLPVAFILAGVLADGVFEPLFAEAGPLVGSVLGEAFGLGPGRGIGFMFSTSGAVLLVVSAASLLYPRLRLLEDEIPMVEQSVSVQEPQ